MRHRVALIIAVALLLGALVVQPATSALVIRGVHGTKVTWKAVNGSHTVTSISKNWSKNSTLGSGATTSFTFKTAGTYRFRCTFHSDYNPTTKKCTGMCGKVVVS